MGRRVFVTGYGLVCGNGNSATEFWDNCSKGISGLKLIPEWEHMDIGIAGIVPWQAWSASEIDLMNIERTRRSTMVRKAMWESLNMSGLDTSGLEEIGIYMGIDFYAPDELFLDCVINLYPQGKGEDRWENFNLGYSVTESVKNIFNKSGSFDVIRALNLCTHQSGIERVMRHEVKIPGRSRTINNLCVSSAQSIGEAFWAIQSGEQDVVLAGGLEEYSFISAFTFSKLGVYVKASSPEFACIPFDENRKGTVLGEGAGILVLESEDSVKRRGGKILAEILGYGTSNNLYHVTNSPPDGRGLIRSMQGALKQSCLQESEIDLVVAHGTGTYVNDSSEATAINSVFPSRPPVHSLKSYVGHTLSAAGVLNVISGMMEMQNSWLLPTLYLKKPAKNCDLNHIPQGGMAKKVRNFISNAAGFGGFNASLVLGDGHE